MPSRRRSSTVVRPIGFGRRGDRVANTPCGRLSEGGVPSNSSPCKSGPRNSSLGERSTSQRTMRCEKPSMSVSPGSNSGRILSTPSASCLAPRPLGTSLASLYGLLTNPIGREVNIRKNASICHTNAATARILLTETNTGFAPSPVAARDIILNMTQEARELLQKALALPENERAELAGNLISSLDATVDQDVDAAWQQEVVRRLHEVQSGKVETVSWEEVQQKGRTLLHGK